MFCPGLSTEIEGCDLLSIVPELCADCEPCFAIGFALSWSEVFGAGSAGRRRQPAGEFAVSGLGVLVTMTMYAVHAGCRALVFRS